jgi:hypothetical protein
VLGVVMTGAFSIRLNRGLAEMAVPAPVLQNLEANEIRLAAMEVPAGVGGQTAAAIRSSIDGAFVFGFRLVMVFCAGLSLGSAAMAWGTITGPDWSGR